MEINYNLPLELNCLMFATKQEGDYLNKATINYKAFIEWNHIIAIESFTKNNLFPESNQDDKTVIVTSYGSQYIIKEDVEKIAQTWASYKIWKSKQVHKSIFSAN